MSHLGKSKASNKARKPKDPKTSETIPVESPPLTRRERQQVDRLSRKSRLLASLAMDTFQLGKMNRKLLKGYAYCSPHEFVLKHGRLFQPQQFPAKYAKWRGNKHDCFLNALLLATVSPELNYAEGYVMPPCQPLPPAPPMTMPHAWCVDANDSVVDPTLYDMMGLEYCGFLFQKKPLWQLQSSGKPFGFLFNAEFFEQILSGQVTDLGKHLLK